METPLGDKLFDILAITFAVIFVAGWALLPITMFLQWILPKRQDSLEDYLQKVIRPLNLVQKYSGYGILILLAIRFISGLLGWGAPLPIGNE